MSEHQRALQTQRFRVLDVCAVVQVLRCGCRWGWFLPFERLVLTFSRAAVWLAKGTSHQGGSGSSDTKDHVCKLGSLMFQLRAGCVCPTCACTAGSLDLWPTAQSQLEVTQLKDGSVCVICSDPHIRRLIKHTLCT